MRLIIKEIEPHCWSWPETTFGFGTKSGGRYENSYWNVLEGQSHSHNTRHGQPYPAWNRKENTSI